MKKIRKITFILAFVILFTLTGCGNKVKCEKVSENIETKVTLKYNGDDEVTSIEYRLIFSDEDIANTLYEYYSNLDGISDLKLENKVISYTADADSFKDELYAVDNKIDTYKTIFEGEGYTCR